MAIGIAMAGFVLQLIGFSILWAGIRFTSKPITKRLISWKHAFLMALIIWFASWIVTGGLGALASGLLAGGS